MARIFLMPSGVFTEAAFVRQLESADHEVLLLNPGERTAGQFIQRFSEAGNIDLVAAFNHHYGDEINVINLARKIKDKSPIFLKKLEIQSKMMIIYGIIRP